MSLSDDEIVVAEDRWRHQTRGAFKNQQGGEAATEDSGKGTVGRTMGTGAPKQSGRDGMMSKQRTFSIELAGAAVVLVPHKSKPLPLPPPLPAADPMSSSLPSCPPLLRLVSL